MSKKIIFLTSLLFVFAFLGWLFYDIPSPKNLSSGNLPVSTKIFDRKGKLIYEIYADQRRTPVDINKLPDYVKNSTIAIEDREFYKHHGFSLTGIARAFYKTVFKRKLEGGSTLTQQLVKNSLLTPERTIKRKIKEFVLATLVEIIYPKDKILEMYLNQIPYGSTAYGIESASELYFGKEAKDLTLAEAALLAGLPAAPTAYSPFGANPERAKVRQELVLKRMVEDGYISQEEADKAKKEELKYAKPQKLKAPHFTLWVKELLAEKYGDSVVEQGGLRVTTTLDLELQEFAEEQVASEVGKLKKQNVGNGIALVTRPKSGEILAMVGSKDYFAEDEDGKVNVIFSLRQPGSSIKPLNYALAIENKIITASTPLADIPTCFVTSGQPPYCPKNYDNTFHGIQQVRFALGNSLNIPAVRVLALNGIENFIDFAKKMGITTFDDPSRYGLSLTLGGGEVRPYDMAIAFGVFANQGIKVPLNPILKVEDWKGKVYEETKPDEVEGERVLSAETAFIISNILSDNGARSLAFGASSLLNVKGHPEVSVKTGTTNDRRDNWTIGYTTHILALSWVGNNNNKEMSGAVSGVSGASPIWNKIIKYALDKAEKREYNKNDSGHGIQPKPDGVVGTNVCIDSGNKATDDTGNPLSCPTRFEYFFKDKVGAGIDMGQKDIAIDKTTGALADKKTPPENIEMQNKLVLIDPLGTAYCFDCTATQSATISYPLLKINR
ncbi:MAG: Multimodular transpeptidase-transglycosylase [Candidatus Woesebacteria bacterium]|nr:MAG: Multimodular transpeptidase-transglycosylase [Candidatus Woesebacteria bacterium]